MSARVLFSENVQEFLNFKKKIAPRIWLILQFRDLQPPTLLFLEFFFAALLQYPGKNPTFS